jgi:hypothetical protein
MGYEYEKLIGYIDDLIEGDGGKAMAKYIDCPQCGSPMDIQVHREDRSIHFACSLDASHIRWDGYYDALPAWIGEYKKLNT